MYPQMQNLEMLWEENIFYKQIKFYHFDKNVIQGTYFKLSMCIRKYCLY